MQVVDTQAAGSLGTTLNSEQSATATTRSTERSLAKDAFRFALVVWVVSRLALSVLGGTILAIAPDSTHDHVRRDYPDITLPSHDLYGYTIGLWNIYDVPIYTSIAEDGYGGDLSWQTAYFPGYPLLIKLFSFPLAGNYLLSALLVANLFALLFFWFLYRLVDMDYGAEVARRAVVWAAIFPSSFFLFMGYTESMVLACMVGALLYARLGKWWAAGLLAGLAALTKEPGIAVILPLAYVFWQWWRANRNDNPIRQLWQGAWLLLGPLATMSYLAYRYLHKAVAVQDITDVGGAQRLSIPGFPLLDAIKQIGPSNTLLPYNLLDISFILLGVVLIIWSIVKLRSTPYSLLSMTLGLMNLSISAYVYVMRPEVNSPRRLLLVFPIFILLALITSNRSVYKPLAYVSAGLYIVMAGLFANWIFVS